MRPLKKDPKKDPTLLFELEQFQLGKFDAIIGVDEAGRGAVAGPVSVGAHAVLRGTTEFPEGLRDSKLLSEARREWLYPSIEAWGIGAVGFGSAAEVDSQGITVMLAHAARQALLDIHGQGIDVTRSLILLDGSHDWLSQALKEPLHVVTRVGADLQHASVAAASLRAKVMRDRLMLEAHESWPMYAWDRNKGYGAEAHYAGIREHGLNGFHRKSWIKPETVA